MIGENRQLVADRWSGWVWEITTRWRSRLQEKKLLIILEEFIEYRIQINQGKPKDVHMWPIRLANTRISTDDYAHKSPRSLKRITQKRRDFGRRLGNRTVQVMTSVEVGSAQMHVNVKLLQNNHTSLKLSTFFCNTLQNWQLDVGRFVLNMKVIWCLTRLKYMQQ